MAESFPDVAGFLSSLDNNQRERFLGYCEHRESPYQIWLYASALGYEGDFPQLEDWLKERYPQIDRRKILMAEAVQLERDINLARLQVDELKPGEGARNVAALSKELRGHLGEVERMTRTVDRRGLVLSGADRLLRVLQELFAEDEEMQKALSEGFDVVLAQLSEER